EQQLEQPRDMELTRYAVGLLGLERKLARRPELLATLRAGIEDAIRNLPHFPVGHDNTIARFADLYLNSLSTLTPRIMVNGDPVHLNNPDNANRIRALLLAGIRAAILWRQSGGGRLTLLLRRNPLLRETRRLLTSLE
ncbi:MAG: lysogenization regulator HflD, partial [Candidatus Contendobacter sp.]|nr:lysogenization regulator HflD [Candidatus Contendobacter sp.]